MYPHAKVTEVVPVLKYLHNSTQDIDFCNGVTALAGRARDTVVGVSAKAGLHFLHVRIRATTQALIEKDTAGKDSGVSVESPMKL